MDARTFCKGSTSVRRISSPNQFLGSPRYGLQRSLVPHPVAPARASHGRTAFTPSCIGDCRPGTSGCETSDRIPRLRALGCASSSSVAISAVHTGKQRLAGSFRKVPGHGRQPCTHRTSRRQAVEYDGRYVAGTAQE